MARAILYPDAVSFDNLPARHAMRKDMSYIPASVSTPDAPKMGFWPEATIAATPTYQPPEVFAATLRDVLYWPRFSLILTNRRSVIRESTSTVLPITWRGWGERLFSRSRRETGICTVFRGVHNNFYHTLIDNMARIYGLHLAPYNEIPNIKLLLPSPPTDQERFIFARYLPKNVSVTVIDTAEMINPDELIFPSFPARRSLSYLSQPYLDHVLPFFQPARESTRINRIFIARKQGGRGRIRIIDNETELVAALTKYGFRPYYLEDLSYQEQIDLFYDAEAVVAAHGAGLSNLLFAAQADVVELFPSTMTMPHYYYLSLSKGQRYRYWRGDRAHFDDNFSVRIPDIETLLQGLGYREARESASS